jgi:hypothetical protein
MPGPARRLGLTDGVVFEDGEMRGGEVGDG